MTSLSILVASAGRPTLTNALASFASQLRPGDQCLLDVNNDAEWGHRARNRMMPSATGDAICFLDDDDQYLPGALKVIREAFEQEPDRMHLFRMRYSSGHTIWQVPDLIEGQVSTGTIVVPRNRIVAPNRLLAHFGPRYEGDFDFASGAALILGEPVWHEDVVVLVRP